MSIDGLAISVTGRKETNRLLGQIHEEGETYPFTLTSESDTTLLFFDEDGESILFNLVSNDVAQEVNDSMTKADEGVRNIYVNGIKVDDDVLQAIESGSHVPIAEGRYWYDNQCGAWGIEGGLAAGFIYSGLPFPGPMPADISGGGTGIFINGREIHPLDQQALMQLFGVTYQGNFWMDAQGNLGYVGGPPIANIFQAAQAKQAGGRASGGSATHGYDSTNGGRGTSAGGGMYSGRTASGKSVFWYPGM